MISCLTFVWFFSFSSTSYVVPVVLYNVKDVSNPKMHIESKNQNTKETKETKNIQFFIFGLQNPRMLILWRRLVLWLKTAATLHFGCYFRCSLVNFKNFIILFRKIWVIYGLRKSWGSAVFDSEHIKNDL